MVFANTIAAKCADAPGHISENSVCAVSALECTQTAAKYQALSNRPGRIDEPVAHNDKVLVKEVIKINEHNRSHR